MQNFNMKRFGRLLRADFSLRRKTHLGVFLTAFGLAIGASLWVYLKPGMAGMPYSGEVSPEVLEEAYENFSEVLAGRIAASFMTILVIFSAYNLSTAFAALRSRQERVAWLMLPASGLEKYLVRLLVHTVVFALYVLAAICLADCTRYVLFPLLGHSYSSALPAFFSHLRFWPEVGVGTALRSADDWLLFISGSVFLLSVYFSYFFGSALLRRRAFAFVTLAGIALLLLFSWGFVHVLSLFREVGDMSHDEIFRIMALVIIVLGSIYLVAGFVWSYRHMRSLPVISRRLRFPFLK